MSVQLILKKSSYPMRYPIWVLEMGRLENIDKIQGLTELLSPQGNPKILDFGVFHF